MESIQNSAVNEETSPVSSSLNVKYTKKHKKATDNSFKSKVGQNHDDMEKPMNKYSKEANEGVHNRRRRAIRRDDNKNTCSLYIQTDPLIWKHIRESFPEVFRR